MFSALLIAHLLASTVTARSVIPRSQPLQLNARGELRGTVTAAWNHNVELLTPITIANRTFQVVLDTGSADMWLFCTDGADHMETDREAYNPSTGKKLKSIDDGKDASFNIKYGSGYAKGSVYIDQVNMGGITVDQAVGCATAVDQGDVDDRNLDGLIGLAFNSGSKSLQSPPQYPSATKSAFNSVTTLGGGFLGFFKSDKPNAQPTFTENAFNQLENGLFTADIKRSEDGVYNFGFIDEERFSTPLMYMPVRSWNQWIVESSSYAIGANVTNTKLRALIDTGTTNIIMSSTIAKQYFAGVKGAATTDSKTWYVPCKPDDDAKMPDFTFTFTPPAPVATTVFPVGSGGNKQEVYSAVIPGEYLIGNLSGKNDGMCQVRVTGQEKTGNGWDVILGDVFFMSQLVVFDLGDANGTKDKDFPERGQIGFASKPLQVYTRQK